MNLGWIFPFYFAERGFELWLSRRNRRILLARGGREVCPESFRAIVGLHLLFWPALMIEAWPWRAPADSQTLLCLGGLALLMATRYWCIVSLGPHWNTRVIVVPDAPRIERGPYRWVRHPNYLVVTLEFLLLPLLLRAPVTMILFSLANLVVLRQRIAVEEGAFMDSGSGCFSPSRAISNSGADESSVVPDRKNGKKRPARSK